MSDLIFAWFAGQHSFLAAMLARALGKPMIVAAADYDLANERWFGYGSMRGGVRAKINNFIFRAADVVLVPSAFSRDLALRNTILGSHPEKLRLVPLAFGWSTPPSSLKRPSLITVGGISPENWVRKGLREFVALSKRVDVLCYLVGSSSPPNFIQSVLRQSPPNLRATGYLPDGELSQLLCGTKVYAQLSYMEGFGCSLAEAMLAECVPVVTRQGSLPEVVGECGYYVDYGDGDRAHQAALAAMEDPDMGVRARQRIVDCFPLQRRRQQVALALEQACEGHRSRSRQHEVEKLASPNL